MLNLIFNFIVMIVLSLMAASVFCKITGLSFFWGAGFLLCLGLMFYFLNAYLILFFLKRNSAGVLNIDLVYGRPMKDGEFLWEKTAGRGVVPKWVSWIGLSSYAFSLGSIIWLIDWFT